MSLEKALTEKLKLTLAYEQAYSDWLYFDYRTRTKTASATLAYTLSKGATLATGGHRHTLGGTFFEPTVLEACQAARALPDQPSVPPDPDVHRGAQVLQRTRRGATLLDQGYRQHQRVAWVPVARQLLHRRRVRTSLEAEGDEEVPQTVEAMPRDAGLLERQQEGIPQPA